MVTAKVTECTGHTHTHKGIFPYARIHIAADLLVKEEPEGVLKVLVTLPEPILPDQTEC